MIYVIGIGISGASSLSPSAVEIIRRAVLLAGGIRHLAEFDDTNVAKFPVTADLDGLANAVAAAAKKGDAAVLATGDPLLYGIAAFLIRRFGKAEVEIIPNVSVVQEAFARIKEDANGVFITSAHGRRGLANLVNEARAASKLAVFTDAINTPAVISGALSKANAGGFDVYVCEAIGTKDERIRKGTLDSVAKMRGFHKLNTMILVRSSPRPAPALRRIGISDAAFKHRPGMITKEEIRVIALSKMDIQVDSVVWDIGSCSGSVAIEAGRLACSGQVYAVEKNAARVKDIRFNIKRLGVTNVEVLFGSAPQALMDDAIPLPDVVFVGGGGSKVGEILDYLSGRIRPGARVVATAVTIETASSVTSFFKKAGWQAETTLVSLAKTRNIGELNLIGAYNPVFIISASKPC